jgi:hypothetical protein
MRIPQVGDRVELNRTPSQIVHPGLAHQLVGKRNYDDPMGLRRTYAADSSGW